VIRKSDGKVYAMKRVKIGKMGKKEVSDALNEIRFLASIRHKNIVGFLEAFLGTSRASFSNLYAHAMPCPCPCPFSTLT
jgi:serine/threonine protein kinase